MARRLALHLSSFLGLLGAVAVTAGGCGGGSSSPIQSSSGGGDDGGTTQGDGGSSGGGDSAQAGDDGSTAPDAPSGTDAAEAGPPVPDGPPTRTSSCTPLSQQTGTAVNTYSGRLDGYLVYVVPQGGPSSCNGDFSHVHLQVKANGSVYDVAVDIGKTAGDTLFYEQDMPLPQHAWLEGWHNFNISYPSLGVHASQFTSETPAALGQKIVAELANVNHIAVFGHGYQTQNGCHDVHYNDGATDGAIVIEPLSPTAHVLFFRFSTQSF